MCAETVLITGAGGFIGSNLVDHQLARGRKVIALDVNLDRLDHLTGNDACCLVGGDVRDKALLEKHIPGVDFVFHLASAHLEVSKSESYFWEINVHTVRTLLELSKEHAVRRFVHCSSVGVYGPLEKLPADEDTDCHPEIVYEQTKFKGEEVVRDYVAAEGLSAIILRPAWVYGPRCPRTLKLFRTIKKKRFFMIGKGQNMRHPIYISDMLQAFDLAAIKDRVAGETIVIAAARPVRLQNLVEEIIQVQNLAFRPATVPLRVMTPICWGVECVFKAIGKEPPFSTRSLKFFTESSAFDISKARRMLGYQPQISLREGLQQTYEYYKKEQLL